VKLGSMMPQPSRAAGRKYGKPHFAAGHRLFALLAFGLAFVPLIFLSRRFGWLLVGWDLLILVLFAFDLRQLPLPASIEVERSFAGTLDQLESSSVTLTIENRSPQRLRCAITDAVPEALSSLPIEIETTISERQSTATSYTIVPGRRGDCRFGPVYLRYEGPLRIAQRWAVFDVDQTVRVYPSMRESGQQKSMLMRSRQIELRNRMVRQRGHGREFESLREFHFGDERRDICWTATARRSKLVTTLRQSERSQTIWTVVDCGRLMRARQDNRSKLDFAVESAVRLAQLANYGGDSSALLGYGQRLQQQRLPGRGNQHIHSLLDQLALLEEERGEADHLHAAATLMSVQKRRAMIVWITDLADLAITTEVVTAALQASKRHLVVVALLSQVDVLRLTATAPSNADETFLYAAASETIRRRELMIARLRSRGVHVIEVNAPQLTGAVLNKYLEVKQKNLL